MRCIVFTLTLALSLDGDLCKTYRHSRLGGNLCQNAT